MSMSEYLTFTLWRQREERMSHELEHQRVVQERVDEQKREQHVQVHELSPEPSVSPEPVALASEFELVNE